MARYIAGFVDVFNHLHPFIHMPTFRISNYTRSPELVLALLAVGAQYRYEYTPALHLYSAARSIVLARMHLGELSRAVHLGSLGLPFRERCWGAGVAINPALPIDTLGATLLLAMFASWQADPVRVRESFEYQPLLARLARDCGLSEEEPPDVDVDGDTDGNDWLT